MKKVLVVALMAIVVIIICAPAIAAVPVCVLGGPTAMYTSDNPRQLGPDENFILTDRPLVVHLQFKPTKEHPEQVGECMLPSHTWVAQKNGIMQWAKPCGNDEVNKNIFVTPPPEALQGPQGPKGDKGDTGPQGPAGPATSSSSLPQAPPVINNIYMPPLAPVVDTTPRPNYGPYKVPTNHHWGVWAGVGGGVAVIIVVLLLHHSSSSSDGGNLNTGGAQ